MPAVVAIDPGVVNYALALKTDQGFILCRESVEGKDMNKLCQNIKGVLDRFTEHYADDTIVLIERQMRVNHKMNCVKNFTFAYFAFLYPKINCSIYKASLKTTTFHIPTDLSKCDRKKTAILYAISILEDRGDLANVEVIKSLKKKDDVCDCILMVESYLARKQK